MCLAPNVIPNPNVGRRDRLSFLVDTKSQFIKVPCGHCRDCIAVRQSSIVQRLQVEELTHHLFYCTLTYNNESLPYIDTSTGYRIYYASRRDFTLMCKRLKKSNVFGRPWMYFCVSELGEKKGRPHFHCIFLVEKYPKDTYYDIMNLESLLFKSVLAEWRRNYGSTRSPLYRPLCTYVRKFVRGELKTNFDLHYMNSASSNNGNSDVAFYVTKYMLKPSSREVRLQQALKLNLVTYSDDGVPDYTEYNDVWKLVRPGMVSSPHLGLSSDVQRSYVRDSIVRSLSSEFFPKFFNTVNGKSFPLSRYYYRTGVFSLEDQLKFLSNNPDKDHLCIDDRAPDVVSRNLDSLSVLQKVVESHDCSSLFNELDF